MPLVGIESIDNDEMKENGRTWTPITKAMMIPMVITISEAMAVPKAKTISKPVLFFEKN